MKRDYEQLQLKINEVLSNYQKIEYSLKKIKNEVDFSFEKDDLFSKKENITNLFGEYLLLDKELDKWENIVDESIFEEDKEKSKKCSHLNFCLCLMIKELKERKKTKFLRIKTDENNKILEKKLKEYDNSKRKIPINEKDRVEYKSQILEAYPKNGNYNWMHLTVFVFLTLLLSFECSKKLVKILCTSIKEIKQKFNK